MAGVPGARWYGILGRKLPKQGHGEVEKLTARSFERGAQHPGRLGRAVVGGGGDWREREGAGEWNLSKSYLERRIEGT